MFSLKEMNDFLTQYSLPEKLFDLYRVVNPVTHQTFNLSSDNNLIETDASCYDIWNRGRACKNCISMHACNEGKQYFKLELLADVVYLVFSLPIEIKDKTYSLELVKNVTKSIFIANENSTENKEIAKIIDNLNEVAIHDLFTGLYNKKYVLDQLQQFLAENKSNETLIGMLVDIDGLMAINSKYGHHMGDVVIKRISSILFSQIKNSSDFAARYAGDKFCLFFKNSQSCDVDKKKAQLENMINTTDFQKDKDSFSVTVSIATEEVRKGEGAEDYMERLFNTLGVQKELNSSSL